jgi:acetyltransferase
MRALDSAASAEFVKGIAQLARQVVVKDLASAQKFAQQAGYPVVLKAVSPRIIHKTEAGAVRVVHAAEQLGKEFAELKKLAQTVLVQEFVTGNEFILGLKKDATFGHVVIAGIGGIYVELYKDVSFRVCPIGVQDAEAMLNELQGKDIFAARGKKLKKAALVDALVALSRLPQKKPNIAELDINPFILNDREGRVVDARVVLE